MTNHEVRIDYRRMGSAAHRAYLEFSLAAEGAGLERSLLELVKLRASQINGCAYCVDMHSKDARARGETEQRLYSLLVWREGPFFTARERAALAWTEALTRLGGEGIADELYRATLAEFGEVELVQLTFVVMEINGWNRLAAAFRPVPGGYEPVVRAADMAGETG